MQQHPEEPAADKQQPARQQPPPPKNWARRIFWFVAIWGMSILALGAVTLALRLLLKNTYQ